MKPLDHRYIRGDDGRVFLAEVRPTGIDTETTPFGNLAGPAVLALGLWDWLVHRYWFHGAYDVIVGVAQGRGMRAELSRTRYPDAAAARAALHAMPDSWPCPPVSG